MSTNIYNGRLLAGGFLEVYGWLLQAKEKAVELSYSLQTKWAVERAVAAIDKAKHSGTATTFTLSTAISELEDRQREVQKTGQRDPLVDFDFELWLFPYTETETLCILNSEQPQLIKLFDEHSWVRDYSYWNSSDPDENVSDAEWDEREQAWNKVLPGAGVPSDRCLTLKMSPTLPLRYVPDVRKTFMRHVPSLDVRISRLASELHTAEVYSDILKETDSSNFDFSTIMFANKQADSDKKRRAAIKKSLSAVIKKLTLDDLLPSR